MLARSWSDPLLPQRSTATVSYCDGKKEVQCKKCSKGVGFECEVSRCSRRCTRCSKLEWYTLAERLEAGRVVYVQITRPPSPRFVRRSRGVLSMTAANEAGGRSRSLLSCISTNLVPSP